MTTSPPSLSWLHCNQCFRSFEHHNRINFEAEDDGPSNSGSGKIIRSDLIFSFTSCGHFLCHNCIQQFSTSHNLQCPVCQESSVATFPVDQDLHPSFLMYLKSPLSLLEDSLSIMAFQQTNAVSLIKNLRLKVSQQKETLGKARQELSTHKILKTKNNELSEENSLLHRRLDDVTRVCRTKSPQNPNPNPNHSHNYRSPPNTNTPTRLSLKSPKTKSSQFSKFSYNSQNLPNLPPLYYGGGRAPTKSLFESPSPSPSSPQSLYLNSKYKEYDPSNRQRSKQQTPQNSSMTSSPLQYNGRHNTHQQQQQQPIPYRPKR